MQQQPQDGVAVDTSRDATDEIDVWYAHRETGGTFGFSLPLPKAVVPQVANGNLVRIDGPDGTPEAFSPPESMADGTGGEDIDPADDPILHPCLDCGDLAVKADGVWTDQCAKHTPKPTAAPAGAKRGGR